MAALASSVAVSLSTTVTLGPLTLRTTQLAVEVFTTQPARARATQLALEVYLPITAATRTTQVALEVYVAQAARARVTQTLVELWAVMPPCTRGDFPIDPDRQVRPGFTRRRS